MSLDERANLAAQMGNRIPFYLHGAAYAEDRGEKRALLVRAFTAYGSFVRQMSELEQLAPNAAREGLEAAAALREFVEGQAA